MGSAKSPRRVLIVDDDPHLNALLGETLRSAGFEVTSAENVDEAIAAVATSRPDLAVLDIKMQGASGLDLGAALRDDFGLPFVFLSLMDDEETVRRASEMGAVAYLVKPLDMRNCLPTIEAAFARAEELRRLRETETQLSTALQQSREISMAIGILMERYELDEDRAFQFLVRTSQTGNVKLRVIADEIIAAANTKVHARPRSQR